jgi:MFS family permease
MGVGSACFGVAYASLALDVTTVVALAPGFLLAGVGIACVETAESAAVAAFAPEHLRGSAFGLLATAQSLGNLLASALAGVIWSTVGPAAAFRYLVVWMVVAAVGFALLVWPRRNTESAAPRQ